MILIMRIILILGTAAATACAGTKAGEKAAPRAVTSATPTPSASTPSDPSAPQTPPVRPPEAQQPPSAVPAAPAETAQVGQPPKSPPPTGTAPAAQASQPSANEKPEPPLMAEEQFRDEQPPALASPPRFEAPVPLQRRLKNGARVLIVENHQVPLVAIDIRFLHGIDADPAARPGLAEFVADTVDEGTRSRPAEVRANFRTAPRRSSKQPASSQRRYCWWTAHQGGMSCGRYRQGQPVRIT